ncbi:MAG: hypothetical protein U0167_15100 [bacterium]
MEQVFRASRWTQGNLLFPSVLRIDAGGVRYEKRRLFGSTEELINVRQIASVRLRNGLLFSSMVIETTGGSQPVTIDGLRKRDARSAQDAIQRLQGNTQVARQ